MNGRTQQFDALVNSPFFHTITDPKPHQTKTFYFYPPNPTKPMKPKITRLALTASLPLAFASHAQAQTFNPANDGGTWGTAVNWAPASVPNAVDAEAILNGAGPSATAPATLALDVLLDGNYTLGKFIRSVPGGVAATFPTSPTTNDSSKGLTLQKSTGTPEINVVGDVFFYSAVFGNQGFEKTGPGRFTFRFNPINQTYTGPVTIRGGTLGINQDSSLGDVNNDIEITPTTAFDSTLFAEPGNNANAITLPATRTITLNDPDNLDAFDPCLSANAAAVMFTIDGDIGEVASSGCYLKKTGAGVVVLNGTNSWSGGTIVSAGVLTATKPTAFPGYADLPYIVNGTSTLAVRYGDASPWMDTEIGALLANENLAFANSAAFGIDTTGNAAAATFAGDLSTPNFAKIGSGTLVMSDPQSTIAAVSLYGGTLEVGASGELPSGLIFRNLVSGTTLDLGGTTASFADLQEVNGGSTTISNGSLTYTGPTLTLSGNNGTITDLSGLSSFTYSTSGTELKLENANNVNASQNATLFAAGTNTITASGRILVGGGGSNNNGIHLNTARFGINNTIRTNLLQIGSFNTAGLMNFQTGLIDPTMKIRAADGTSPIPNLVIGETSSGVRSGAGTLDLTGGSADILAAGINIGRHIAGSNNGATSTFTVTDGTVQAVNLVVSEKRNGGVPATNAIVNHQGTAAVSIDSIVLGQTGSGAAATGQVLQASYILDGGTLTTAAVNGFAQIETASATGTVSATGDLAVTLTSGDLGAPVEVSVSVNSGDIPTGGGANDWAAKVANALNANTTVFAKFVAIRVNNQIILTRRAAGVADATLNLAIANGTAAGITEVATSTDTVTSRNTSTGIARNLILRSGTLINKAGADLTISGVTLLAAGNTTAVVNSTAGQKVVLAADATYSARMNSAAATTGSLTVEGVLDLTAQPPFFIFDDAETATQLAAGEKLVLINYSLGSLTGSFAGLADGATVNVTKGDVTNSFIIDYNDPAFGSKAVTLTAINATAGNDYASWATDNGIAGQPFAEDFDKDGLANGVEYALGLNPTVSSVPPGIVSNGGLTTTYLKGAEAKANGDVTWKIETSTDLGLNDEWTVNTTLVTETPDQISITFALGSPVKNFARLRVTQVP
jgi:autotransporter-associated beta strand protein